MTPVDEIATKTRHAQLLSPTVFLELENARVERSWQLPGWQLHSNIKHNRTYHSAGNFGTVPCNVQEINTNVQLFGGLQTLGTRLL